MIRALRKAKTVLLRSLLVLQHYLFPHSSTFSLSTGTDPNSPLKPTIKPLAMALASLRRIGAPISLLSKHQLFRPTSSVSAAASHSAKVSDRIVRLFAIDFDGNKREVVGLTGQTLLRALANAGLIDPASHRLEEIEACSAECEVHIAQEWLEKMPEPSYEERYCLFCNISN